MLNDYENVKEIGHGSFSIVYKARHKTTKQMVAIKRISIKKFEKMKNRMSAEIAIIRKLNHPNVLKFYEIYKSEKNVYILSELCDETLTKTISTPMSEKQIFDIYHQIISGIKYLYENKIFHRDIKPENILLKGDIIKLADFGFAKEIKDSEIMMTTMCGTPIYMAPEILLNEPYTVKSDIWSLGVILYQMMYNENICKNVTNINELTMFYKNKNNISFPKKKYSDSLIDLVKNMLIYNPNERISWDKLFSHQWLNKKISFNSTEQSLIKSDVDIDENILFCDPLESSKNDSELYDNNTSSSSEEQKYNVISRPIEINKRKISDSEYGGQNLSLPKTESLKINVAGNSVDLNEDHFGESLIQPFTGNYTYPLTINKTVSDAKNINDSQQQNNNESNNYSVWNFIKKSAKFFSL